MRQVWYKLSILTGFLLFLNTMIIGRTAGIIHQISFNQNQVAKNSGITIGNIAYSLVKPEPLLQGISGVKTIGGIGANYNTLTAAIIDINANGLSGNVELVLQSGYLCGSETFPILFPDSNITAVFSILVYPAVSGLVIQNSLPNPNHTIYYNGSRNVIIDGRVNGQGSVPDLIVSSTSNNNTIVFSGGAGSNVIRFCNIRGGKQSSADPPGTIAFINPFQTSGCNANIIEYCDVRESNQIPGIAIYSSGFPGKEHTGNIIRFCNIANFFNPSGNSFGIYINNYSRDWTIQGNHFFQTAPRTSTSGISHMRPIYISPELNNPNGVYANKNFQIIDNYIGGSAPFCGGTPWTQGPLTRDIRFVGIDIQAAGPDSYSFVKGNTIRNFDFSTNASGSSVSNFSWTGIYGTRSKMDILQNTIGSDTVNNLIFIHGGTSSKSMVCGIVMDLPGVDFQIEDNRIGSINISSVKPCGVIGINIIKGKMISVNRNTIGSKLSEDNVVVSSTTLDSDMQSLYGIYIQNCAFADIAENTISHMRSSRAPATSDVKIYGINKLLGSCRIFKNTVSNISTNIRSTFCGINSIGTTDTSVKIMNNTIFSLINTTNDASYFSNILGIYIENFPAVNYIDGNFIHSFGSTVQTARTRFYGIYHYAGVTQISNNMIYLGMNPDGTPIPNDMLIQGIHTGMSVKLLNNSVVIGGGPCDNENSTACIASSSNGLEYYNNIFANYRSKITGAHIGGNYAMEHYQYWDIKSDNNIFYTPGLSSSILPGSTINSIKKLREISPSVNDLHSIYADPGFMQLSGTASQIDLHLKDTTVAEGTGMILPDVKNDADLEYRGFLSPVDIGADAADKVFKDLTTPDINYTCLHSTSSLANRTLIVTIKDKGGIPLSGTNCPRIYFRRSLPTATAWKSVPGILISGTAYNGQWQFTIDYTVLGTGYVPAINQTYQYFVIAQDASTPANAWAIPFKGLVCQNVNTVTTPPSTPNSYKLCVGLNGIIDVGPGMTYTSLSKNGGVFAKINSGVLTGDLTVKVHGDLAEDGVNTLLRWTNDGNTTFKVKIIPADSSAIHVISGFYMIKFDSVVNLCIDGSLDGVGRFLLFRCTSSGAAFSFLTNCSSDTIQNCIIESGLNPNSGTIFFSSQNNHQIQILNNLIRGRTNSPDIYQTHAIVFIGSEGEINRNNTIAGNYFENFSESAITSCLSDSNLQILNNHFYNSIAQPETLRNVIIAAGMNPVIMNNFIGGSAPFCSGNSMKFTKGESSVIYCENIRDPYYIMIDNNRISNISFSVPYPWDVPVSIIHCKSSNAKIGTIAGNYIGDTLVPNAITCFGTSPYYLIYLSSQNRTIEFHVANNIISNITLGDSGTCITGINATTTSPVNYNDSVICLVSNNKISNLKIKTGVSAFYSHLTGIWTNGSTLLIKVENNFIKNLSIDAGSSPKQVNGIIGERGFGEISGNFISQLFNKTSNGILSGIKLDYYYWEVYNNIIELIPPAQSNLYTIYGILDFNAQTGGNNCQFNTIWIGGNSTMPSNSYGFAKPHNQNGNLRNNIIVNKRIGSGSHYCLSITYPAVYKGDYNNLYSTGFIGITNLNQPSLSAWQTATSKDAHSKSVMPSFIDPVQGDFHLTPSGNDSILNHGTALYGMASDIDQQPRHPAHPDIGADEISPDVFSLKGRVIYDNDGAYPLKGAMIVRKTKTGIALDTTFSDASGHFEFPQVITGKYVLVATKTGNWDGLSVLDALRTMRHVTGVITLSSLELKAADVTGDHQVTVADALEIMKRVCNQINSFPSGEWVFTIPNYAATSGSGNCIIKARCCGDTDGSYHP